MSFLLFTSSRSCLHTGLIPTLLSITSVWCTRCLGWLICVNLNMFDNLCLISLTTVWCRITWVSCEKRSGWFNRLLYIMATCPWWEFEWGLCCTIQMWVQSLTLPSNLDVFSFDLAHYEWKDQLQNSDDVLNLEAETCQRSGTFRYKCEV